MCNPCRARLADIAAQAGVSEATVSRVLNGRPGVADGTRQAVLTALDVLGYERPARLKQRSAGLVGLIVPELDNPIFPAFAQVIESALAQHGYTPVLCTQTPGGVHEDDYTADAARARGLRDRLRLRPARRHARPTRAATSRWSQRGLPIVLVNGYMRGRRRAVHQQRRRRLDGPRRHATWSPSGTPGSGSRSGPRRFVPVLRKIAGFREAMRRQLGADDVEPWVECSLFSRRGRRGRGGAAGRARLHGDHLRLGPDGARRDPGRPRALGRPVPADVSVVGYDDSPLIAFTDPPLTTVRQSVQAMGSAAVRALLDEIAGLARPARGVRLPARAGRARLDRARRAGMITTSAPNDTPSAPDRSTDHSRDSPGTPPGGYRRDTACDPATQARPGGDVDMRITDVLRRKGDVVVTVSPDVTVRSLLDLLAEHRIGAMASSSVFLRSISDCAGQCRTTPSAIGRGTGRWAGLL